MAARSAPQTGDHLAAACLAQLPLAVLCFDEQGRTLWANAAADACFAAPRSGWQGRDLAALGLPAAAAAGLRAEIVATAAGARRFTTVLATPGGPRRHALELRRHTAAGAAVVVATVWPDEAAARPRWLESVFHGAFELIGLLAPDGTLLEANQTALDACGLRPEQVLGHPLWEAPCWDVGPHPRYDLRGALARARAGALVRDELLIRGGDASLLWIDFSLKPLYSAAGEIEMIVAEGRDITLRRRAELERDAAQAVVDAQTDVIARHRPDGTLTYVNDAYCRLFGRPREALLGTCWRPVAHADDLPRIEADLERLSPQRPIVMIENRVTDATGASRWMEWVNRGLFDAAGRLTEIQSTGRDVSARKVDELERQASERRMQEAQKLEGLGLLAGGIAHDFNNILTCILGNAALAREQAHHDDETRACLLEISDAAGRAAELCRQMLVYAGRARTETTLVDLDRLVEESLPLLRPSVAEKARLVLRPHGALPAIVGDPTQLRQVLLNLVLNAAEAIVDRGRAVTVETRRVRLSADEARAYVHGGALAEGEHAALIVRDEGCGMDPETLRRVFEPFFTTKLTGRGLGLAAVHGIVRSHRGAMRVDSAPGDGTTFALLFPAVDGEVTARAAGAELGVFRGHGSVLLVDDDPAVRRVVGRMVESLGYTALLTADAEEAVALFRARAPEVRAVLLDMAIGATSGEATLQLLQQIRPDTPVVVMSGLGPDEVELRLRGRQFVTLLHKPFTPRDLQVALEQIEERR